MAYVVSVVVAYFTGVFLADWTKDKIDRAWIAIKVRAGM